MKKVPTTSFLFFSINIRFPLLYPVNSNIFICRANFHSLFNFVSPSLHLISVSTMAVIEAIQPENEACASSETRFQDPRTIARGYQLMLCKRALAENTIVYLETGCGKTHIAVLLIYELGHLIRKTRKNVCVFLAPTVHLVQQQAMVIENSTNFKVKSYFGNSNNLDSHSEWEEEIEQHEVLVMTPEILLRNLRHCFMRMEFIVLLIFDECHHAQKRHPYAQIMKEFYKDSILKQPRIFGMTASPIIGKGGSNQLNYTKCINSLENLLDAKVCSVEDKEELESLVASPNVKIYSYDPNVNNACICYVSLGKRLEGIKEKCLSMVRENVGDLKVVQKKAKFLRRLHENLLFCLSNLGLWGALQAACILQSSKQSELTDMIEMEDIVNDNCLADLYLRDASLVFKTGFVKDDVECDTFLPEALEEPFFSDKLLTLIRILSIYRSRESIKCIVFVKRIITARSLACILEKLKILAFWKCDFLVGYHSGLKSMSRKRMNGIVEKFRSGKVNLLIATNVAEEGLDIQTCCLVIRFDLPTTVASFIQSRGRARMQQSEYVFLVERGNQSDLGLVKDFITGENLMSKEITHRTSGEAFDELQEIVYKVESTGASISTGCSVSLLHHYCSKLPRDEYFKPMPEFYFIDDLGGVICRIILPSNAPIHQIDGQPCSSKEEARRVACLKACRELHVLGAFTDYLLPGQEDEDPDDILADPSGSDHREDENSRAELHEMLVPAALREPWNDSVNPVSLNFYFVHFIPIPRDRQYRTFGLFLKAPLPKEAETMQVDLHLARGRIVKTELIPSGKIDFDGNEILYAQNFQEMFLKIILDRDEFSANYVPLGKKDSPQLSSSVFYLLLPVRQHEHDDKISVDWIAIRRCLSSPVFRNPDYEVESVPTHISHSLKFFNGSIDVNDIPNSLVLTRHNSLLFCIVEILHGTNGNSPFKDSKASSYAEYYKKKFGFDLRFPEQPLLKAKQLFALHNLLHNRLQVNTEAPEIGEHFVELPPELCSFKVIGFPRDIASSLSLLPSMMHRLENLLVAIELKESLSASFPEGSKISANRVLEALTTEKCMERFSLERLEVLGDAFLKYVVGRHVFLSYESLDEGQLTRKRSSIVNNSHLYKLATRSNLQMYVRDQPFTPCNFFALGRSCTRICNKDTERSIHFQQDGVNVSDQKCSKCHHWLHRKTIADVVEALVGAFIVDSGFKAATAFLRWIGIQLDFELSNVCKVCMASDNNMSLINSIDIAAVESLLGYNFQHKGLLLQAFIHPSYNKHCGGCYQRLEFLGDAVLDYVITSYLYSVYPNLKPGQLTDLRSMTVNNNSFAHIAVCKSLHSYLISDSQSLSDAISKFVKFCKLSDELERDLVEEPNCPKVLGDLIESCAGAMLLDSGFNLEHMWRKLITLLDPVISYSSLQLNPIREVQELCQSYNLNLSFCDLKKEKKLFTVEAIVSANTISLTGCGVNMNKRVAKRMAAQGALEKLKAKGYKHKVKSLKEVLQMSKKCEAELIGFDETPATVDILLYQPVNVPLQEARETSSSGNNSNINNDALGKDPAYPLRPVATTFGGTSEIKDISARGSSGGEYMGSAKSHLYELCKVQVWEPPSFVCVKSEGPDHVKLFTYKVVVQVKGEINTLLECYSEAKSKKKLAADDAAEGALWWLKHQGFSSH